MADLPKTIEVEGTLRLVLEHGESTDLGTVTLPISIDTTSGLLAELVRLHAAADMPSLARAILMRAHEFADTAGLALDVTQRMPHSWHARQITEPDPGAVPPPPPVEPEPAEPRPLQSGDRVRVRDDVFHEYCRGIVGTLFQYPNDVKTYRLRAPRLPDGRAAAGHVGPIEDFEPAPVD